jgi:hypothetical protein
LQIRFDESRRSLVAQTQCIRQLVKECIG